MSTCNFARKTYGPYQDSRPRHQEIIKTHAGAIFRLGRSMFPPPAPWLAVIHRTKSPFGNRIRRGLYSHERFRIRTADMAHESLWNPRRRSGRLYRTETRKGTTRICPEQLQGPIGDQGGSRAIVNVLPCRHGPIERVSPLSRDIGTSSQSSASLMCRMDRIFTAVRILCRLAVRIGTEEFDPFAACSTENARHRMAGMVVLIPSAV